MSSAVQSYRRQLRIEPLINDVAICSEFCCENRFQVVGLSDPAAVGIARSDTPFERLPAVASPSASYTGPISGLRSIGTISCELDNSKILIVTICSIPTPRSARR